MSETAIERAVLLADITGSTPLYEQVGDSEAARRIGACIDWMRDVIEATGGTFIAAKGDDVLATFDAADPALTAIERILARMPMGDLSVHAGLNHGFIVESRGDVFGDVVNLTARLASLANPGEVLISRDFVDRLPGARAATLRPLSAMTFKGKSAPVEVFSLNDDTQFLGLMTHGAAIRSGAGLTLLLGLDGERRVVGDGASIVIGRAPESDIVVAKPWVSRRHATVTVRDGRVQLTDHSSYGSYLWIEGAVELVARRETVLVTGTGRISPGASAASPEAVLILFEVVVDQD